jgi:hypothetical protein
MATNNYGIGQQSMSQQMMHIQQQQQQSLSGTTLQQQGYPQYSYEKSIYTPKYTMEEIHMAYGQEGKFITYINGIDCATESCIIVEPADPHTLVNIKCKNNNYKQIFFNYFVEIPYIDKLKKTSLYKLVASV